LETWGQVVEQRIDSLEKQAQSIIAEPWPDVRNAYGDLISAMDEFFLDFTILQREDVQALETDFAKFVAEFAKTKNTVKTLKKQVDRQKERDECQPEADAAFPGNSDGKSPRSDDHGLRTSRLGLGRSRFWTSPFEK